MVETEAGKDRIIQELITHINSLEQKINTLKEELGEENDLQTVNRLDIINLKNEIDKIKISLPVFSPDVIDKIKNMEKLMERQDSTSNIQRIIDDIEQLKKMARNLNPDVMDEMHGEISALYEIVNRQQPSGKAQKPLQDKEIAGLKKRLGELESKAVPIPRCNKCGSALKPGARFCGKCGKKL